MITITPTAQSLIDSKEFRAKRRQEQQQYIERYKATKHTRPDQDLVIASAEFILNRWSQNND